MSQHTTVHIGPDTRITWNEAGGAIWVDLEETDGTAQKGARVTIFVDSQPSAIRLVSVFLTIRAGIIRKRDAVVAKLMKQGAVTEKSTNAADYIKPPVAHVPGEWRR